MKKIIFTLLIATLGITATYAQQQERPRRGHFSPEEFRAKQREFITKTVQLTPEEAEAFFPIYFKSQEEIWNIERESHRKVAKKMGEQLTEEEWKTIIDSRADTKIKIAQLQKQHNKEYLKVIPASKVIKIEHAEKMFQHEMLKKMSQRGRKNRSGKEK